MSDLFTDPPPRRNAVRPTTDLLQQRLVCIADDSKAFPFPTPIAQQGPEVTVFFWIIKVLCTTVGETAADFLNVNLNFGLTGTSVITGVALAVTLVFQLRAMKYIPGVYWLTVTLVSAFGTLVTDNMSDNLGVPLELSTLIFAGCSLGRSWRGIAPSGCGRFIRFSRTTVTSLIFVAGIIGTVLYLSVSKADVITTTPAKSTADSPIPERGRVVAHRRRAGSGTDTRGTGYYARVSALAAESSDSLATGGASGTASPMGDLTTFSTITKDTQDLISADDQAGATTRVADLEYEWDNAQARLKSKDTAAWTEIDGNIDTVVRQLRSTSPNPAQEQQALTALLAALW